MNRDAFRFFEPLRVRWAEVDLQKIVFNGHYLMYLDTAVAGYWRALAMPYHETMQALAGDLYVRKATLEYHASARYDERLDVGIRCERIGNSSIVFTAGVFRGEAVLVTGELVYVFADPATQTSRPVPDALRAVLRDFESGADMVSVEQGGAPPFSPGAVAAAVTDAAGPVEARLHNRLGVCVASGVLRADGRAGLVEAVHVHEGVRGIGLGTRVVRVLTLAAQARGLERLRMAVPPTLVDWGLAAGFQEVDRGSAPLPGDGAGAGSSEPATASHRVLQRALS